MKFYAPPPEPQPVHTTELDWRDAARADGWQLRDGTWIQEGKDLTYDDGDWVYFGDGVWEDADVAAMTVAERAEAMRLYAEGMTRMLTEIVEAEQPAPEGPA